MQYKQDRLIVDAVQFDPKVRQPKGVSFHRQRGYEVTQNGVSMMLKAGQYIITYPTGEITVMGAKAFEKVFTKIDSVVDPKPELTSDEVLTDDEAKVLAAIIEGTAPPQDTDAALNEVGQGVADVYATAAAREATEASDAEPVPPTDDAPTPKKKEAKKKKKKAKKNG